MKLNVLWATLAGGLTMMVLGFIIYMYLVGDAFNDMGLSSDIMKTEPDMLMILIGNIAGALILAYIFSKWANISTFATGAQAGAIIGLLVSIYSGFIQYGTTNISSSLTPYLVDAAISAIMWAVVGGVVGLVLGKTGTAS